ncbi:hypothetical protein CEY16_02995 [Halalkalibacillus sediminis]|uniref:DUF4367 domain-containing protein n=1 Tax=Halalkalibacillus sediminis TaxID=2018042 RepID=A0A2I0QWR2_9BACI|nr:hypothetical protein [Halalkalibacillus sediminis]PKR78739.1 hypothetical protein CEY16_02995 [Halalkalibacillus sediminis]
MKVISFVGILLLSLLLACSPNDEEDYTDAEEKLSEAFDFDIHIVDPEGHSLSYVKHYNKGNYVENEQKATLGYSVFEEEKEVSKTEEQIKSEEDSLNMEYIYGPYSESAEYQITISFEDSEFLTDPNLEYESEEIDEQTVHYMEKDSGEFSAVTFFDEVMFEFEISLDNDLTQQDAFDYIGNVITEHGN